MKKPLGLIILVLSQLIEALVFGSLFMGMFGGSEGLIKSFLEILIVDSTYFILVCTFIFSLMAGIFIMLNSVAGKYIEFMLISMQMVYLIFMCCMSVYYWNFLGAILLVPAVVVCGTEIWYLGQKSVKDYFE